MDLAEPSQPPQHAQQLQQLAALLLKDKTDSDSVTFVPELIPEFVRRAMETVLSSGAEEQSDAAPATTTNTAAAAAAASQDTGDHSPSSTATAPALAIGTQHLHVTSASSRTPVDWVMTTCLVPEGLPTAAAAETAGGLAAMEVVCRLLMLQNCQPAAPSAAFSKALSKVRWQRYGLQYKDFFVCDDDSTGIVTLGVLPDAVMVPLSLMVCCCNTIEAAQDAADDPTEAVPTAAADGPSEADATDQTQAQPTAAAAAAPSTKRRRGGSSRQPTKPRKPPSLSQRREMPLWVGAIEASLDALKAQLPEGYLQGKQEAVLAACLPPIAASLASIMMRAADSELRRECCSLLDCQPADLQDTLLAQLQDLAAEALADKAAAAARGTITARQASLVQQSIDGEQPAPSSPAHTAATARDDGVEDADACPGSLGDDAWEDQDPEQHDCAVNLGQVWLPQAAAGQQISVSGPSTLAQHQQQHQQQQWSAGEARWPAACGSDLHSQRPQGQMPAASRLWQVGRAHAASTTAAQDGGGGGVSQPSWGVRGLPTSRRRMSGSAAASFF